MPQIRGKALSFIGNYCRNGALPDELLETMTMSLMEELHDDEKECRKMALYALGNVIFKSPALGPIVMADSETVLELMNTTDLKMVENAIGLLGNVVRKSETYVGTLIEEGVLDKMIEMLDSPIGARMILEMSVFCQYGDGQSYLKKKRVANKISKVAESIPNERVQRIAGQIVNLIK